MMFEHKKKTLYKLTQADLVTDQPPGQNPPYVITPLLPHMGRL